jgi:glycosyltransferase involved in cell wall biosynthesis
MRILWLSYYYLPHVGGGTWATYYLSRTLARRGHEIQLVVPNVTFSLSVPPSVAEGMERTNPSGFQRVPRFPIPRVLGPFVAIVPMFFAGLKYGRGVDIIISQFHPHHLLTPAAVFLGKVLRIPVIIRADDVFREMGVENPSFRVRLFKIVNSFNEFFIRYANVFLIPDSQCQRILLSRIRGTCPNCQIGLSNNGVDLDLFNDLPSKKEARDSLKIRSDEKALLFIGRFSGAEYGIDILLKAFSIVRQERSDVLLFLIGDTLPLRLRVLVDSLGIRSGVKVFGPMLHTDVAKFIVAADVCVGPLLATQTSPLKIMEYMVCRKPIVTGRGSVNASLNPATNFSVVDPEPVAVSEALLRILKDTDYAESLVSNSLKAVSALNWERVAVDLEKVLSDTVEQYHERLAV